MPLPHRANPTIKTNWVDNKDIVFHEDEAEKRAYYEMSVTDGKLLIKVREEKQKDENGEVFESNWKGCFEFDLKEKFAQDLLMFLSEYLEDESEPSPEAEG